MIRAMFEGIQDIARICNGYHSNQQTRSKCVHHIISFFPQWGPELIGNVLFCGLTSFDHSFEPTSDVILDSRNFDTGAALNADSTTRIQHARLFGIIEAGTQFRTPK